VFRLLCISGDDQGKSYLLKAGENILGRKNSDIIIDALGVSKQHAKIVIQEDKAHIIDLNSKNGTFINGIMVRDKKLKPGDKIGIYNNVYQFEVLNMASGVDSIGIHGVKIDEDIEFQSKEKYKPSGLLASFNSFLDVSIMPFFESMTKKYPSFFIISITLIMLTSAVTILVTYPIIAFDQYVLEQESSLRGIYLANLLSSDNKDAILSDSKKQASVDLVSTSPGVKMAFIIDIEGRILAPSEYQGQFIGSNIIARAKRIISGELKVEDIEQGKLARMEGGADLFKVKSGEYWVTSPIRLYSQSEEKNVIAGFSVINFTSSSNALSFAASAQRILIGLVLAGFMGLLLAMVLSRLFTLPFIRLYDEVDLTFRGDTKKITYNIYSKYAKDLIDLLNILIKKSRRIAAKDSSYEDLDLFAGSKKMGVIDEIQLINSIGNSLKNPFIVIDSLNSIITANRAFNDIASYKSIDWNGISIIDAISDQNLLGLILSLINKFKEINQDISDEIFINDKPFRITVNGIKDNKGEIGYYCISIEI